MINPNAEAVTNKGQALAINCAAAQGLAGVMRTNIGPTGTMKMCAPLLRLPDAS